MRPDISADSALINSPFTIDVCRDQLALASITSLSKKPHIRPALAYPSINDPYSFLREPILEIKRRRPEGNAYLHSIAGRIALRMRRFYFLKAENNKNVGVSL